MRMLHWETKILQIVKLHPNAQLFIVTVISLQTESCDLR